MNNSHWEKISLLAQDILSLTLVPAIVWSGVLSVYSLTVPRNSGANKYFLWAWSTTAILIMVIFWIKSLKRNFNHENKSFVNGYRSIDECWRQKPKTG